MLKVHQLLVMTGKVSARFIPMNVVFPYMAYSNGNLITEVRGQNA